MISYLCFQKEQPLKIKTGLSQLQKWVLKNSKHALSPLMAMSVEEDFAIKLMPQTNNFTAKEIPCLCPETDV